MENEQVQDDGTKPVEIKTDVVNAKSLKLSKSIKKKIRNTLALSLLGLGTVGSIGLYTSNQFTDNIDSLQKNTSALKRQGIVDMYHEGVYGDALKFAVLAKSDLKNKDLAKDLKKDFDTASKDLSDHEKTILELLDESIKDDFNQELTQLNKEIKPLFVNYINATKELEKLTLELLTKSETLSADELNNKKQEIDKGLAKVRSLFDELEEKGTQLFESFERNSLTINKLSDELKQLAVLIQGSVIALSFILSFILIFLLFKSLNKKLSAVLDQIELLKRNNLDLSYDDKDDDEFKAIGDALVDTAVNLKASQIKEAELADANAQLLENTQKENQSLNDSIVELLQTMFAFTQKDLSVRAPVSENVVGTIADSVNMVIASTATALSETSQVAGMVEESSSETQEKSTQIYQLSEKSKEIVNKVLGSFQTSLEEIQNISKVAKESKLAAEAATESTLQALNIVKETVGSMSSIRDTISTTETKIKKLAERSQEIGFIVELIGDISERTHVLSLNAAIQAAIAGDAGRGFAAIAGEIQKLAENTKEATQKISRLVTNIQTETGETIQMVNTTIDKVVNGVALAESSGNQMTETQLKTQQLAASVLQISSAITQQEELTKEMRSDAESLGNAQEDFSNASKDQLMQARSLLGFARRLKQSVEEFKLA